MAQPPRIGIYWRRTSWKQCPVSTSRFDNPILSLRVFDTSKAQEWNLHADWLCGMKFGERHHTNRPKEPILPSRRSVCPYPASTPPSEDHEAGRGNKRGIAFERTRHRYVRKETPGNSGRGF